ncbi:hypothetical protein [Faecalibaculum rodentium]|uniref:hypothetical protein n=1 Tax=Faecalibaculum rodentium TaxID=1702221 RepID=UPI003514A428
MNHFHLIKEFSWQADEVRLSVMRSVYREFQRLRRKKRRLEDLPDPGTIANREHIQALAIEVQKYSRSYYFLKKFHWMVFKNPDDKLFDPGRAKKYNPSLKRYMNFYGIREALYDIRPVLCGVINIRRSLIEICKYHSGEEGSENQCLQIKELKHSRVQKMKSFAGTLWNAGIQRL